MPLEKTKLLIATYGINLRDGTILNPDLEYLLLENFSQNSPVFGNSTDDLDQYIYDFIHTLSIEEWPHGRLHELNKRIIMLAPASLTIPFSLTLAKAFFAYEMLYAPLNAYTHFDSEAMKRLFPTPAQMKNFRDLDLYYITRGFQIFLRFQNLPKEEGEYQYIVPVLQNKIMSEAHPKIKEIATKITALVIKSHQNRVLSTDLASEILSDVFCLLEGRFSASLYILKESDHLPASIAVPITYAEIWKDVVLMSSVSVLAYLIGGMAKVPAVRIMKANLSLFRAKTAPNEIPYLLKQLAITIAEENCPRIPSLTSLNENANNQAQAQSCEGSRSFHFFSEDREIEEDYILIRPTDFVEFC